MSDLVTTSDLRRTLMAAICNRVYTASSEQKRVLAETLDVLPFEAMSDDTLVEVATPILGAVEVERIVVELSAERYEVQPVYYLCPECQDQRVIAAEEPGRWRRCSRCNPAGMVEPPVIKRSKYRGARTEPAPTAEAQL